MTDLLFLVCLQAEQCFVLLVCYPAQLRSCVNWGFIPASALAIDTASDCAIELSSHYSSSSG